MLVLVATERVRGVLPSDRHFATEGELVTPVVLDCPDVHCDVCARAWFGLASHGGTTTAMVADLAGVSEADLRRGIHDWLDCGGWIDLIVQACEHGDDELDGVRVTDPVAAVADLVDQHVRAIRTICEEYPVGTVLSRLGDLVAPRVGARAA